MKKDKLIIGRIVPHRGKNVIFKDKITGNMGVVELNKNIIVEEQETGELYIVDPLLDFVKCLDQEGLRVYKLEKRGETVR